MSRKIALAAAAVAIVLPIVANAEDSMIPDNGNLHLTQEAWSKILRNRGESKRRPGYVRYVYNPQEAFPIRTREGMVTTIKLPAGETIVQAYAGDEAGFQVGIPTPETIVIKANFPGVDTNLIAYGESGKIYTFYLRSDPVSSGEISDFLVDVIAAEAKDAYSGSQMDTMTPQQLANFDARNGADVAQRVRDPYATMPQAASGPYAEYAEWTDFDPSEVRQDLAVYVPRNVVGGTIPYKVFRDDRFTYIDYGPNASQMTEWPTPMIVIQGVEGPVGNRTAGPGGRMIVIEALGEFVLRNGQRMLVVKPRDTRTDPSLVEYATLDAPMQVPRDLPAGRRGNKKSAPQTVVPVTTAATTPLGEHPSTIVPIRSVQDRPGTTGSPVKLTVTETATSVKQIDVAKGKGAPLRTVNETTSITTATSTGAPVTATPLPAPANPAPSSPGVYYVSLGTGPREVLEDRWRSAKVQHYDVLKGRNAAIVASGNEFELQVPGYASTAPAIALCTAMSELPVCAVRRAN